MERLEELRLMLGPPADFVIGKGDVEILREWAILTGHPAVSINVASAVELANLYHASAPPVISGPAAAVPNPIDQKIAADILMRCIEAIGTGPLTSLALDNYIGEHIKRELEQLAPRELNVISERGTYMLPSLIHYKTEQVLKIVALGHPIMMVGPAGCGKTTIGHHVAQALNLPFYITNVINDEHQLMGFKDGHGNYHSTPFRMAFENGGIWIADEIDAWDATALLAANSALANGFATFPDVSTPVWRHANFRMVATANTFGTGADRVYVGRNELDAASLDRFAVIETDYDLTLERHFSQGMNKWLQRVWDVRKKVNEKKIRHVVSSRAIGMGATALKAGLLWSDVEEIYLFKGMSAADRSKI